MKKKQLLIWVILLIAVVGCFTESVPEPDKCSICADISRHAPCIINLSTGEKLELDIYEPHPFLVGEIAEEQPGGYFSFIKSAGVYGYKIGAECIVVSIPIKSEKMNQHFFCNPCRKLLANETRSGYILVDLKNVEEPVVYCVNTTTSFFVRCYSVLVKENIEDHKYEITITGHYEK